MKRFLVIALLVAATGCGGDPPVTPNASAKVTKPTAAPSPSFDAAAVKACHYAEPGVHKAALAIKAAGRSAVPGLRSLGKKYGPDPALSKADAGVREYLGSTEIGTWCLGHHVKPR